MVPTHTVLPGLATILTDGTTTPVTDIVIEFEVAVGVDIQAALLVIIQLTTSPFNSVEF